MVRTNTTYDGDIMENYVQAYRKEVSLAKLLSKELLYDLISYALLINSHPDLVLMCVLSTISIMVGPTPVKVKNYPIFLNVWMIAVALSGYGKSPALKHCTTERLLKLQAEKEVRLMIQDMTAQGLMRCLQLHNGTGLIAHPELSILFDKFDGADSHCGSLKSLLNQMYSNESYCKDLANSVSVQVQDPYLSIVGMIQPYVLERYLPRLVSDQCGFINRMLMFSVSIAKPPQSPEFDAYFKSLPDDFVDQFDKKLDNMYGAIYDYFNGPGDHDDLQLDCHALEFSDLLVREYDVQKQDHAKSFEDYYDLKNSGCIPEHKPSPNTNESKTYKNTMKTGILIHLFSKCFGVNGVEDLVDMGERFVLIRRKYLKRGSLFVNTLRSQQREYTQRFLPTPSENTPTKQMAKSIKLDSIEIVQSHVLLFPGKEVSARMFRGKYSSHNLTAGMIRAAMDAMAVSHTSQKFIGTCKYVKSCVVFNKVNPERVTDGALALYGVSRDDHACAFNKPRPKVSHGFSKKDYAEHIRLLDRLDQDESSDQSDREVWTQSTSQIGNGRRRLHIDDSDSDEQAGGIHSVSTAHIPTSADDTAEFTSATLTCKKPCNYNASSVEPAERNREIVGNRAEGMDYASIDYLPVNEHSDDDVTIIYEKPHEALEIPDYVSSVSIKNESRELDTTATSACSTVKWRYNRHNVTRRRSALKARIRTMHIQNLKLTTNINHKSAVSNNIRSQTCIDKYFGSRSTVSTTVANKINFRREAKKSRKSSVVGRNRVKKPQLQAAKRGVNSSGHGAASNESVSDASIEI